MVLKPTQKLLPAMQYQFHLINFIFLDILDNRSGAACCTGDGDILLRFCPSFLVVEMMHQGTVPEKACQEVVRRVCQSVGTHDLEMGTIAMNIKVNIKGYKKIKALNIVNCDWTTPPPGLPAMHTNVNYNSPKLTY